MSTMEPDKQPRQRVQVSIYSKLIVILLVVASAWNLTFWMGGYGSIYLIFGMIWAYLAIRGWKRVWAS